VNEGDVTVTVSDTGLDLCERIKAVDATVTCTGGGTGTAPTITSFTVNPTSITSGGSATLTWILANDAVSCTKTITSGSTGSTWSGTMTGSQVTNGSHSQVISNITSNSTYRLQCTNSNGSSLLKIASVNIATSASCTSQPPPPSPITKDTTILSNFGGSGQSYNGTYVGMFPGTTATAWPGHSAQSLSITIDKDKYVAAQFNSGNADYTGNLVLVPVTGDEGPAAFGQTWAISECPGDFNTHLGQAKCKSGATLRWSTEGTGGSARCQLDKNKTYYLNIIHSFNTTSDWSSTCSHSYCGLLGSNTF